MDYPFYHPVNFRKVQCSIIYYTSVLKAFYLINLIRKSSDLSKMCHKCIGCYSNYSAWCNIIQNLAVMRKRMNAFDILEKCQIIS